MGRRWLKTEDDAGSPILAARGTPRATSCADPSVLGAFGLHRRKQLLERAFGRKSAYNFAGCCIHHLCRGRRALRSGEEDRKWKERARRNKPYFFEELIFHPEGYWPKMTFPPICTVPDGRWPWPGFQ